ncbi:hypothetical protein [Streptomyces sp. NPDC007088]|uniref:hypothetical protein n=1 Tax=Streptomyces sp. NPDC007088 TaxID=3364773 RepID=UPI0036C0A9D6
MYAARPAMHRSSHRLDLQEGLMHPPAPVHPRPRPAVIRGLAIRFALIIGDPRLASALLTSCADDTIEVRYPEAHITCRLTQQTSSVGLLGIFHVTHLTAEGDVEERHDWDLVFAGPTGSSAQREAVLQALHAFRCAANASRLRIATRVVRSERAVAAGRTRLLRAA